MTYTAATLTQAIGQTILVRTDGWVIPMVVLDAKAAWGKPRLLVTPVNGSGEAWIELERIVKGA